MIKSYKDINYFESRPDIVKIFDDLEDFHNFCRFELRDFNPAELYKKNSPNYKAYLASKLPHRRFKGNRSSGASSDNKKTRR